MAEGDPGPFRLYAFRYATREAVRQDHFMTEVDDPDRDMPMDYFVWLATDGRTHVLIDTGFSEQVAVARGRTWLHRPADCVRAVGVDPAAIQHVVLTHLHYDHAGTLEDFPGATFHLQEREYEFATGRGSDSTRAGFEAADMTRLVDLFYQGRLALEDGSASPVRGVSMHLVGGHTPGLQVVSVRTERGRVVVMSDASHFYEHFERGLSFPHADDPERSIAGLALIDDLADSRDHVVPGHDPLVLARYPAVRNDAGLAGAALHRPPTEASERLQCH
jgi:glyoxylase-like metal-dependent hydrolase (beta-lactamase superfamily II)